MTSFLTSRFLPPKDTKRRPRPVIIDALCVCVSRQSKAGLQLQDRDHHHSNTSSPLPNNSLSSHPLLPIASSGLLFTFSVFKCCRTSLLLRPSPLCQFSVGNSKTTTSSPNRTIDIGLIVPSCINCASASGRSAFLFLSISSHIRQDGPKKDRNQGD